MKNLTLKLLALLLACIMVLPMIFACNDEKEPTDPFLELTETEKAFQILNDETYDNQSYSLEMTQEISSNFMGYDLTAVATGTQTQTNKDSDSYIFLLDTTTATTIMGITTTTISKSGYTDGKMFEYVEMAGQSQGVWSPISKEDYITYSESRSDNIDSKDMNIKEEDCQSITCVQLETGNWVATFTGITGDSLSYFNTLLEGTDGMLDPEKLESVTIALVVDSARKPVGINIDFSFSADSNMAFSIEGTYTIGDAVTAPSIDLTGYLEAEDLRAGE